MAVIPGQLTTDGHVAVELTTEEVSLIVTALVAFTTSLHDAGVTDAAPDFLAQVRDLANTLARCFA